MEKFTIERLGMEGNGIAAAPEGTVYVPYALPGEVVEGRRDAALLRDVKILTPAAARVKAPCAHFGRCGGCSLQHASDEYLAGWKQDVVARALHAQGLDTTFKPVATSPSHSRRRGREATRQAETVSGSPLERTCSGRSLIAAPARPPRSRHASTATSPPAQPIARRPPNAAQHPWLRRRA